MSHALPLQHSLLRHQQKPRQQQLLPTARRHTAQSSRGCTHHAAGLKVDEVQLLPQLQVVLGGEVKAAALTHQRHLLRHILAAHRHVCGVRRPDGVGTAEAAGCGLGDSMGACTVPVGQRAIKVETSLRPAACRAASTSRAVAATSTRAASAARRYAATHRGVSCWAAAAPPAAAPPPAPPAAPPGPPAPP